MRTKTLLVGLTGGIGSGKTSVSERFAALGVPVIDTDVIAREVVAPARTAYREIVAAFGAGIVAADGNLDRAALNKIVFEDTDRRAQLEGIVHPAIRHEVRHRVRQLEAPYCIIVVPLLVETDFVDLVDRILVIDAEDAKRRQWVASRSGLSAQRIDQIFAAQATREQRLAVADDVVVNDSSLDALSEKVASLHHLYLALAGSNSLRTTPR